MESRFAVVCCFLAFSCVGGARQLTGTVYSDHSGPSGRGTGYVALSTSTGLVEIHYAKPIKHRFSDQKCWELGAIWTVWTRRLDNEQELIRAQCDGTVDQAVHSAWGAVLEYIRTTARDAGHELGFQPGRRGPTFLTMNGVRLDVSGYLNFPGNGMCLEVKERVSSATVVIASSADCYFDPDIDFRVERLAPSVWKVTSVQATGGGPQAHR